MTDLTGKCGAILGVANKRSIAWAIAQAADRAGAHLAISYQGERLEENVRELAATLTRRPLLLPCDVARDEDIERLATTLEGEFGGLDFLVHAIAFAPREAISQPFIHTSRDAFRVTLDVSTYSLVALARATRPLFARRGGGSILTLTYLGSERVFPNYNVMGVAKAALEATVRYLASDLGPDNVRVNAISAGPIRTLAASGVSGFPQILQIYRDRSPLRRNVDAEAVAQVALCLLGPAGAAITADVIFVDAGYHAMGM
jgi:enoyl-[acyl-carrier protein] reductase I